MSYAVMAVFKDGVPRDVGEPREALAAALADADRERLDLAGRGYSRFRAFVGVVDLDDGERGWLTADDLGGPAGGEAHE